MKLKILSFKNTMKQSDSFNLTLIFSLFSALLKKVSIIWLKTQAQALEFAKGIS